MLTVWGDGKVNLNTASTNLLLSYAEYEDWELSNIIESRMGLDGVENTLDDGIKSIDEVNADSSKFKLQSELLKVTSIGKCGNNKYSIECIMKIEGNKPRIVFGMKKFKINNKDKIISIICPTFNGIEWIIVRNSEKEKEIIDKGFYEFDFDEFNKILSLKELPNIIKEKISENIYISIPTNKVLLINNTYPTLKSSEINQIVKIQIDKISPYPPDKLVYGNEIIENNDESSDVIMMGVHNDIISIAESYSTKKLNLLSIDCRVFSWIELMSGIIDDSNFQNQILIIDDSIDLVILFFKNKKKLS